ncbi:MAG: hypothetical protein ACPHJD_00660 [Poseidonia sp.]
METLKETHRIRYPPFEAQRWIPNALPIAEQIHEHGTFASVEEATEHAKSLGPAFQLGSNESWLMERTYSFGGNNILLDHDDSITENDAFVDVVRRQRQGWYLIPNPIHNILRRFINGVVIVLLLSLFYLFISPLLMLVGLPVYGLETVRWGLLDYPALAVFVVPLIFAPLLIRVLANLIELTRQNKFLATRPPRPTLTFDADPVADQPLRMKVRFPQHAPEWNHIDVFWRVGVLPPSREVLLQELGREHHRQPPPGLSTELPHHWVVGLDDGTAGGEDAPMEMQEVRGGLYLRPMRIMASSKGQRCEGDGFVELEPPTGVWPGSVNTDLLRVHWECIVRIDRARGGALLWVEPLRVAHPSSSVLVEPLPLHDGRSELDIT